LYPSTSNAETLIEVSGLKKYFPVTKGFIFRKTIGNVKAVDDVSFRIPKGHAFGLVGESGSGKTTTGNLVAGLLDSTSGTIKYREEIITKEAARRKGYRKRFGIVFQDPYSSLDPRMKVVQSIVEPLNVYNLGSKKERLEKGLKLLEVVGLPAMAANRYPHQFSGGQRQRIAIARAIALSPELIIADEPVSALDVSEQARIVNLFKDLINEFELSYLFISHDLSIVKTICQDVAVMYLGKIVEIGTVKDIFEKAAHPYTIGLLRSIPVPNPATMRSRKSGAVFGEIPSPLNPPKGCRFNTRCPYAKDKCRTEEPQIDMITNTHGVACHFWNKLS